jgi:hypothetical protein
MAKTPATNWVLKQPHKTLYKKITENNFKNNFKIKIMAQDIKRDNLLVDLGDVGSFANEKALITKRIFGFTITNTSAAAQKVILTPSYAPSDENRVIRTGHIPYSAGAIDLNANSVNDKTIEEILAFVAKHPTRILNLQIESTDASQLSQQLVIQQKSIFSTPESEQLTLASFKSPNFLNDKMVIVSKSNFQLDVDTEISVIIPAGASTTFTFYAGGVFNDAELLYKLGVLAQN